MEVKLENVSKKFGDKGVLKNISLSIGANQVYCLLGKNGAGKSTLIHIACDIVKPDRGNVLIDGRTYRNDEMAIKQSIGLQSQYDTLIEELNTFDYLQFIGGIYHMKKHDISSQIGLLTSYFFDDKSDLKKNIETYSTGMKRKVSICAAFLHKPPVIFLDEPFANIDAVSANALCKLISGYSNTNRCIIISSHDMLYVNKIATHIGIIDNEAMVYHGPIAAFRTGNGLDLDLLRYVEPHKSEDILLNQLIQSS